MAARRQRDSARETVRREGSTPGACKGGGKAGPLQDAVAAAHC